MANQHTRIALFLSLMLIALGVNPVGAGHDRTCHPNGEGGNTGPIEVISFSFAKIDIDESTGREQAANGSGRFIVSSWVTESDLTTRGTARIQDGTSNTILITESVGSVARCSADPTTGEDGLIELRILVREPRTQEYEQIFLTIVDGTPLLEPGSTSVNIHYKDHDWEGILTWHSPGWNQTLGNPKR